MCSLIVALIEDLRLINPSFEYFFPFIEFLTHIFCIISIFSLFF